MSVFAKLSAALQNAPRKRKALDVTPEMLTQIERVAGVTLTAEEITVFETVALTTLPIRKRGSMFHDARVDRSTLDAMAVTLNTANEAIPIHTMHNQHSELPVGKAFFGQVQDNLSGYTELRVMFYLLKSEADLTAKIEGGVLDEVSVAFVSERSLCSKCGFDYQGPEADFMHQFTRTCPNDHVLGEDGTHLKMQGLSSWMELSLVSRGASQQAKILSRYKETVDRLAASGSNPEAALLVTSTPINQEEPGMDAETKAMLEAMQAQLTTLSTAGGETAAQLAAVTAERDTAAAAVTTLTAERDTAVTSLTELQTALGEDTVDALRAQITQLTADLEASQAKERRLADFAATLPSGGVSLSADGTLQPNKARTGAFKTR